MAAPNKITREALQVLRARVRYRTASLRLPGSPFPKDDTPAIQQATQLYVETWIVPILNMLERGETRRLQAFLSGETDGDAIGSTHPADSQPSDEDAQ